MAQSAASPVTGSIRLFQQQLHPVLDDRRHILQAFVSVAIDVCLFSIPS